MSAAVPALAVAVLLGAAPQAQAQDAPPADPRALAAQVAAAGDAQVRFQFPVRAGVCGDGAQGVTIQNADGTSSYGGNYVRGTDGRWAPAACQPGPARVTLGVRGGAAREARLTVGGRWGGADGGRVVDLGAVSGPTAAAYLLDLAARADAPPSERLLLGAAVAEGAVVWPRLLELAREERLPSAARREATFWASRAACDAVARPRLTAADTADRETRRQVVFALSQRPDPERQAALVRAARADRDPAVRCSAFFWLGQGARGRGAADAATLDLYEAVLRGR